MAAQPSEQEIKKLRAELKRATSALRHAEEAADLTGRILETVQTALETIPSVEVASPPIFDPAASDETALLVISDVHCGKKTASYNHRVFQKRLDRLGAGMMSIVEQVRSVRPVRELVIVMNGDLIDQTALYPGQAVDHVEASVIDQIFSIAFPAFLGFLLFCLENFEKVSIYANRGNHGRMTGSAKWTTSKGDNWDSIFHRVLETATTGQERLTWHIAQKDWKQTFRIKGYGFLATHGDMIKRYYSMP